GCPRRRRSGSGAVAPENPDLRVSTLDFVATGFIAVMNDQVLELKPAVQGNTAYGFVQILRAIEGKRYDRNPHQRPQLTTHLSPRFSRRWRLRYQVIATNGKCANITRGPVANLL